MMGCLLGSVVFFVPLYYLNKYFIASGHWLTAVKIDAGVLVALFLLWVALESSRKEDAERDKIKRAKAIQKFLTKADKAVFMGSPTTEINAIKEALYHCKINNFTDDHLAKSGIFFPSTGEIPTISALAKRVELSTEGEKSMHKSSRSK